MEQPRRIDLKKDEALTIEWSDGTTSVFPIEQLRRLSPSADMRELRKSIDANPLTVLPAGESPGRVVAVDAELVGRYAIRISFSDGHSTGLYSWAYLRSIDTDYPANSD